MAKAILEFDLNDPDDTQAHLRCVKSLDLVLFIFKIVSFSSDSCIWILLKLEVFYLCRPSPIKNFSAYI